MDRIKVRISAFVVVDKSKVWSEWKKSKFPNKYYCSRQVTNSQSNVKRPFRITLLKYYNDVTLKTAIEFNGSIRKWYFGKNTRQNLTKKQLEECVKLLSAKIGIRTTDFLNAKVTKLEVGVSVLLKSEFRDVINCFAKYRTFTREVNKTTVYLKGKETIDGKESNFKYKFYDKYLEINKNDKNFSADKKKINVQNKFYCFRFENVVTKVSGVPYYKTNANTLFKILENWEELNYNLIEHITKIHFVDLISDERITNPNELGKRDLEKYAQFLAIKRNGFFEELEKFELNNKSTNRSTKTNQFFKNYEYFLDKKTDYKNTLILVIKKKIDSLV
jgi:hypothetical protein